MPREPVTDSEEFVVEVCWRYYVHEMTQAEIARVMNVTRLRVNQAIQRAKAMGIVKVQIDSPFLPRLAMQDQLTGALGIREAVICPANADKYDYHRPVGAALAAWLTERLRTEQWKTIGVSWGLTLDAAIRKMQRQSHPDLELVSILGGTAHGSAFNSFGVAAGFADLLGAHYSILTAPIYLSAGIDRELFLAQSSLREHFLKFESLDAVLLTCSNVSEKSFLVANGLPPDITIDGLISAGAIGDVLGQFLNADGDAVSEELNSRAIGLPLSEAPQIPEKIMVAAGPHKVAIILAACRRRLVDTLITDDVTAALLLEESARGMSKGAKL